MPLGLRSLKVKYGFRVLGFQMTSSFDSGLTERLSIAKFVYRNAFYGKIGLWKGIVQHNWFTERFCRLKRCIIF